MLSPEGGMWQYIATRSAVIRLRVNQEGGGARSATPLYHPFIWCYASLWRGGSDARNSSISPPSVSSRYRRSAVKIALIWMLRRQIRPRSRAGSWRSETLMLTILHMSTDIHAFFLASRALEFGSALHRAMKSPSYLVGVVGDRRGIRVRRLRYFVCSLRVALQRQTSIK